MAIDLQKAADTLVRDHASKSNLVPFARAWGAADLAGAYAIQAAFVQRMLATHGKRVGYKIGLTSKRMQQMCSIDHPVAGVVLERRLLHSGVQLELSEPGAAGHRVRDLRAPGPLAAAACARYEMDEVAAAVDAVAPDYEVIDDRNSPYPLDMLSLVADNAWNEGIVLGAWRTSWPDLGRRARHRRAEREKIDEGHGRDVLGHPFEPLRWLANHLSSRRAKPCMPARSFPPAASSLRDFRRPGRTYRFTRRGGRGGGGELQEFRRLGARSLTAMLADPLVLARIQFGLNIAFHILFPDHHHRAGLVAAVPARAHRTATARGVGSRRLPAVGQDLRACRSRSAWCPASP